MSQPSYIVLSRYKTHMADSVKIFYFLNPSSCGFIENFIK